MSAHADGLTDAQLAQLCQTCVDDPKAAPGRYCIAGGPCLCHHRACPAHPDHVPAVPPAMPDNVHPLIHWSTP